MFFSCSKYRILILKLLFPFFHFYGPYFFFQNFIEDQSSTLFLLIYFQLTTLVTGFVTKVTTSISNDEFLKQLQEVGILCQFEGLLSCHGDEMGMIEDFWVAVDDLKFVKFQFVKTDDIGASPSVFQDG